MPQPLRMRRMQEAFNAPEAPGVPNLTQAQEAEDMAPEDNLGQLKQVMGMRDMRDPRQQAILKQEQERLMQVQAKQQFTQRLMQRLNHRIGTPEDTDPQAARAAFMTRLMMQMQPGGRGFGR